MNTTSVEQTVIKYLKTLGTEEKKKVLEFTRLLSSSKIVGIPGKSLLSFAGSIDKKDLKLMQDAIDQDCEKVISDEW